MHPSNYDAQNINLQLMDDGCNSSVFPFSNPQNQNHHHSLYESHLQPSQGTKRADQISHRPTIPVAGQLFQQRGFHEDVRLQHHQQLSHPSFSTVNFMGVNENGGVGAMNHSQDDTFLLQNRHNCLLTPNCWNDHEDFVIKGKPLYGGDNKQCSTEDRAGEMEGKVYKKPMQQAEDFRAERCRDSSGKYKLLGELEAMWNLAKFDEVNQAAGSVSALTGENSLKKAGFRRMLRDVQGHCGGGNGGVANVSTGVGHGSVPCVGEEASWRKIQKKKRKMIMKEQLCSMIGFFESLVKQVMDHQEFLHRKLLEVIERMDKERTQKEEEWRCQETAKHNREALARTHEQAMASKREALIASYLEKITGQSINIPERIPMFQPEGEIEHRNELGPVEVDANSRWPRTEVQAPVRVRSALETKFQEPGLEGPLREEVSSVMASKGYNRSAKRCKGNGRT